VILISNKFLIDANCLITPKNQYYAFDLVQTFWDELDKNIKAGHILILDKVFNEIIKGGDELSEWLKEYASYKIDSGTSETIKKYMDIILYIHNSDLYKPNAENEWKQADIADGFLIAAACVHNCKIITNERLNLNLNPGSATKHPKIPDVAKNFNVDCVNIFDVMRDLKFKKM